WQRKEGGFGYPDGAVDLSNSQYAALGLKAAASRGVKVPPEVWQKLGEEVVRHEQKVVNAYDPAGFGYHNNDAPNGSITAAATGILRICESELEKSGQRFAAPRAALIAAKQHGLEWLATHFSPTSNPLGDAAWTYYWLYGSERVSSELAWPGEAGHGLRVARVDYVLPGRVLLADARTETTIWQTCSDEPPAGWERPGFNAERHTDQATEKGPEKWKAAAAAFG